MIANTDTNTDTAPRPADGFTIDLQAGLSAREVDRRIARAHRAGDMGARAIAFYLVDLTERGAHQQLGFHSVVQYAESRYHMRPATTRSYLAVGRALEQLPAIDRALCEGRLFWTQVRELVRVATPETEDAWIDAANGLTARQLVTQVGLRQKGERPTDPARRRIHEVFFKVPGRLNAVQYAKWDAGRAKLEAELGRPVTDDQIAEHLLDLLLSTRPDGSVPGRIAVNDSHYKLDVFHDVRSRTTCIRTADGDIALDPGNARSVLRAVGRDQLADRIDDEHENAGPEVAGHERDDPTSPALRRKILARDGFRCRCCGSRRNLTVHHKKWRRYGGRTVPRNLVTHCEHCHSQVHAGLLVLRGRVGESLRFVDTRGCDLGRPCGPHREAVSAMTIHHVPSEDGVDDPEITPDDSVRRATRVARPMSLDDVIGQAPVVASLRRAVRAARGRGEPAPHILLCGPAGLGKTSLAHAVAGEMDGRLHILGAPSVTEPSDLLDRLAAVRDGDVLFIDEIHRLPARVAETLYAAMDNDRPFTLIGATTDEDLLPGPFRSRFRVRHDLEYYGAQELTAILRCEADRLGIELDDDAAEVIVGACGDTPREALALLGTARDEIELQARSRIDAATASMVLASLQIDERGLTRAQRRLLEALRAARAPLGLSTLADRMGRSPNVIRTVVEPLLIRRGLIARTPRGRVLLAGLRPPRPTAC